MKLSRTVLSIGIGFAVMVAIAVLVVFVFSNGNTLDGSPAQDWLQQFDTSYVE